MLTGLVVEVIFIKVNVEDRDEEVIVNLTVNSSNECVGDTYHNPKGDLPMQDYTRSMSKYDLIRHTCE